MERYHSLDGLRAAMMLLGLLLHSAVSYTVSLRGVGWPYQDPSGSVLFDLLLFFIHLFRMPAFFVMAGFFAGLLFYRRGAGSMIRNRTYRVLVPLVLAWIVVFPLMMSGFVFAGHAGPGAFSRALDSLLSGAVFAQPQLLHLWFLYHLLFFYAAALLLMPLVRRAPETLRQRASEGFGRLIRSAWGPLLLAGVTMLTLLPMPRPWIDASLSLSPPWHILLAYGVFFAAGWLLFTCRSVIASFSHRLVRNLGWGIAASGAYLLLLVRPPSGHAGYSHLAAIALCAAATWLLVFGLIGLFVRYFASPAPAVRYLADASYWMYLVHPPVVIWTVGLLATVALPAGAKAALVLATAIGTTLLSYHYLVRSTLIGALLNGRRYPRQPVAGSVPVAALLPHELSVEVKHRSP